MARQDHRDDCAGRCLDWTNKQTLDEKAAMNLTTDEVKQYWRDYCTRHKVPAELLALGEQRIQEKPDHWADQTMDKLLRLVSNGR